MLKSRTLIALLAVCCAVSAGAQFKPQAGDYVEVIRKTFKPGKLDLAKKMMLGKIHNLHSRDGLVRNLIVGENRAKSELVGVIISNAYNRGNWSNKNAYPELESILLNQTRSEYQLFAVHDEGVPIKVGDTMRLYWSTVVPEKHSAMKDSLTQRMMKALRTDAYKTNGYFAESDKPGEVLGIGIGLMPSNQRAQAHHVSHHQPRLRIENLRVVLVRYEGK
ncbi:MAG TPA: hypothetical protein VK934_07145 [Fimbriimonas sp.]|nr:hypothetical protein [Fimbriimonas sp.]